MVDITLSETERAALRLVRHVRPERRRILQHIATRLANLGLLSIVDITDDGFSLVGLTLSGTIVAGLIND